MRWTRILKYTAVLYVTTFVVGFVFGFVEGLAGGISGTPIPAGLTLALNLGLVFAMFATISSTFGLMSYRTAGLRVLGAVHLVAAAVWLTSFPLNVVLLGQSALAWLGQGLFLELCLLCGLGAGVGARALAGLLSEPKDGTAVAMPATPVAAEPATGAVGGRG